MKTGPSAGTRYKVEINARIENPKEAYSAGNAGTGSRNGLTMNHIETGTRPNSKTGDKGRGPSCILECKTGTETAISFTEAWE